VYAWLGTKEARTTAWAEARYDLRYEDETKSIDTDSCRSITVLLFLRNHWAAAKHKYLLYFESLECFILVIRGATRREHSRDHGR
jgi:hypothetical protein